MAYSKGKELAFLRRKVVKVNIIKQILIKIIYCLKTHYLGTHNKSYHILTAILYRFILVC